MGRIDVEPERQLSRDAKAPATSFSHHEAANQLVPTWWLLWAAALACAYFSVRVIVAIAIGWERLGPMSSLLWLMVGIIPALPAAVGLFKIRSSRQQMRWLRLLGVALLLLATSLIWRFFLSAALSFRGADLLGFGLQNLLELLSSAGLFSFAIWLSSLAARIEYIGLRTPPLLWWLIVLALLTALMLFGLAWQVLVYAPGRPLMVMHAMCPSLSLIVGAIEELFWIVVAVLSAILVLVLQGTRKGLRLVTDTSCHRCGYLLPTDTTTTCPECGWTRVGNPH